MPSENHTVSDKSLVEKRSTGEKTLLGSKSDDQSEGHHNDEYSIARKEPSFCSFERDQRALVQELSAIFEQTCGELSATQALGAMGTITVDASRSVIFLSQGALRLLGMSAVSENSVERDMLAMIHHDDRLAFERFVHKEHKHNDLVSVIPELFRVSIENGKVRWINAYGGKAPGECTEESVVLIILQDVSERKRQLAKLMRSDALVMEKSYELEALRSDFLQSQKAADKAVREKSRFLAVMSHEIRTPLHGIIGSLQLLRDAGLNGPARKLLALATSSAESLSNIANDVIEISRMETDGFAISQEPFDFVALVREASDFWRPMADEKGLLLKSCVDKSVPQFVLGDAEKLRQVVNNYLNNAIKFTHEGNVTLWASLDDSSLDSDANSLQVRLEVRDTGVGITKADQKLLFKEFTQIPQACDSPPVGTGLGLAICRALCSRMGGNVGVSSDIGVGSTFWMTVQLKSINEAEIVGNSEKSTFVTTSAQLGHSASS
ncbi:MAG: PAS domain S-box protein [Halioglobus sp.]|nr:PAS domain S-box protein [Halioglobus sp.]